MVDANATGVAYGIKYFACVLSATGLYNEYGLKSGDVVLCVNHNRTSKPLCEIANMEITFINDNGEEITFDYDDTTYDKFTALWISYIGRYKGKVDVAYVDKVARYYK